MQEVADHPETPLAFSQTLSFSDATEFSASVATAQVEVIQKSADFRLEFTRTIIGRLSLDLIQMPKGACVSFGQSAPVERSFHVPLNSTGRLKLLGQDVENGTIGICGPRSEHWISAEQSATLAYIVPDDELMDVAVRRCVGEDVPAALKGAHILSCDPEKLEPLQAILRDLMAGEPHVQRALSHETAARSLKASLLTALIDALDYSSAHCEKLGRTPKSRDCILVAVRDYLQDHQQSAVQVTDLCDAADVSQPTLYRIFQSAFGIGAKEYLQLWRLHQVRRRLLEPSDPARTVLEVAFDAGFWQLGRFGKAYRLTFGETPSETLNRGRRDHGFPSRRTA